MTTSARRATGGIAWYAFGAFLLLFRERSLFARLVSRDVGSRYKGSVFGILWSLLNPLALLCVFGFVFGVVFQARWGVAGDTKSFALVLFSGLVLFLFASECINRAPMLILQNSNYVKKVVFPLELLPPVVVGGAAVNLCISLAILLVGQLVLEGALPLSWISVPIIVLPLAVMMAACVFLLSSLGVFLRDLGQITGLVTIAMMYLSPVLFPIESVPERYRGLLQLNPLTVPVAQLRAATLYGQWPDWAWLGLYALAAYVLLVLSFAWFWRSKNGFADVI